MNTATLHTMRKTLAAALAVGLGTTLAYVAVPTSPAYAAGGVVLDKTAPSSVLLGADITYTLRVTNPSGVPQFNIGFSDVLPAGMKYKPGSVTPNLGAPTVTTNGSGQQVLVWNNTSDVAAGSFYEMSYTAEWETAPDTLAGQEVNSATAAGSTDAREVPQFTADGTVVPEATVAASTDSTTTDRAPFEIIKSSPAGEMLRGVHDQRQVYTLTVRNNKVAATQNITVTDYLPAGLEYLGCGNEDNSTTVTEEYAGSGPLGVPAINPANCDTPDAVTTVNNPTPDEVGPLTGVYTQVDYTVPDLAPAGEYTVRYVAGIPLQENTMTWNGPEPTADSLEQGSNLDNNNGASTRETTTEKSLTNWAVGTGEFMRTVEQKIGWLEHQVGDGDAGALASG